MTGTQELTIQIPENEWMSANSRMHWAAKSKRTAAIRHRAYIAARAAQLEPLNVAHVTVRVSGRVNNRMDPANAYPTIKAAIDGLVADYGLLPDDDDRHLIGPLMLRGPRRASLPPGWHELVFIITDQTVPWMEGDAA